MRKGMLSISDYDEAISSCSTKEEMEAVFSRQFDGMINLLRGHGMDFFQKAKLVINKGRIAASEDEASETVKEGMEQVVRDNADLCAVAMWSLMELCTTITAFDVRMAEKGFQ